MSLANLLFNTLLSVIITFLVAKGIIPVPYEITKNSMIVTGLVVFFILSAINIYKRGMRRGQ